MKWPLVKVSDICNQIRGVSYKKDQISDLPREGFTKLYRSNNISSDGSLNENKLVFVSESCISDKQLLQQGDVFMTASTGSKSAIGKNLQIHEADKVTFGAFCKVLRPQSGKVDFKYFGYFFKRAEFRNYISNVVEGANINNLKNEHIDSLEIPLPPLPIQKKIAAVLEKADNLRQQSQQMERELNLLAQTVFLDMFGDYRKNAMSLKSSLGEVADVRSGVTKGQKLEDHKLTTVPYMRVANVQDGYLDLSEIKDITVKAKDFEKYQLKPGDVLMTEGGDFDKLGRGAIWSGQIANCIHQNHVFRVRLCDRYISEFFAYYLQTPFVKQYFLKCAKKTTNLASINITQLKGLPIPDESIGKQQSFLRIIDELKALKEANFEQQEQANTHFNSLIQRAFKGELDLKDVA